MKLEPWLVKALTVPVFFCFFALVTVEFLALQTHTSHTLGKAQLKYDNFCIRDDIDEQWKADGGCDEILDQLSYYATARNGVLAIANVLYPIVAPIPSTAVILFIVFLIYMFLKRWGF